MDCCASGPNCPWINFPRTQNLGIERGGPCQDLMAALPRVIVLEFYSVLSLRSLGYNTGIPRVAFGKLPNGTRFGLNDMDCNGTEESLLHCPHTQVLKGKVMRPNSFLLRDKTADPLRPLVLPAILTLPSSCSLQNQ